MMSPGVALGHRYELEERVGAGGFSEVWRARDLTLDRPVAVKVLHAAYLQDGEALVRFQAEARHAGSLAHENIARVYDYGDPGRHREDHRLRHLSCGGLARGDDHGPDRWHARVPGARAGGRSGRDCAQ